MATGDESQKYTDKVPDLRKKFLDKDDGKQRSYINGIDQIPRVSYSFGLSLQ